MGFAHTARTQTPHTAQTARIEMEMRWKVLKIIIMYYIMQSVRFNVFNGWICTKMRVCA